MYSRLYSAFSGMYAECRGHGRTRIRRAVREAARLPAEELARRGAGLLSARVDDALRRFPFYAGKAGLRPGATVGPGTPPVWTRDDQRALFESLAGPPVPGAFVHSTGGSTGVPLRFYVTRESYEWRTAVSDRGYSWAEAEEGRRSLYVWGAPIRRPGFVKRVQTGLHHWLQRRAYFNSFDFGDERKALCCAAINRVRPLALVGYAGNLVELARFVRDNPGRLMWRSRTVVTAAEGLAPGGRELLEEHLGNEVFMSYGSREFMLIGMECSEHRGYHVSSDNLHVEVADEDGRPLPPGETGRILITDLHNAANPFIRYEIGDFGVMAAEPCPCGLPFPLLASVEGRAQELIRTPSGRTLTALFMPHLMKEFPWVEGYQIAQSVPKRLTVRLVAKQPLTAELTEPIRGALAEKVGAEMKIEFEKVQQLAKNRTGKTPIVVEEGTADGRRLLLR